jgi:predicted Fe-Mo cluster-binding NifX family protein
MRIAISVWGERVSPVFDTATKMLVVDFEDHQETARLRLELGDGSLLTRMERLKGSSPEVLLCGAISQPLVDLLDSAGIEVIPFLSGNIEDLLAAYHENRLSDPRYLMPGCCGWRRRRRSRCSDRSHTGE